MDPTPFKPVEPAFACAQCGQSHGSQPCLGGIDLQSSEVLEGALSTSAKSHANDGARSDPLANCQYVGGRYEVLELLGQGGMGAVYKVNHQALHKIFALKALNPGVMTDEKALRRFDAEAKAVGNLSSPYLIQVHDYGLTDSGTPYLVLDYIEGTNLADEIKRLGHIDEKRVLAIFSKVCEGLEHAHHNKIIHRDLKPSNIMLTTDAHGNEIPKIVDFGIAKRQAVENTLTQTGEIFGTPLYMSPEQCLGKPIDNRTDIYSLGCVMYEALTGAPPLSGQNPIETVLKHVNDMPVPLRKQCKDWVVGPEIEQLVMSCLEKQAIRRPANAGEIQENLKRISLGKKAKVRRFLPRLKTHHKAIGLTIAGALIGVSILCGSVLWWFQNTSQYESDDRQATEAYTQKNYKVALKFCLDELKHGENKMSQDEKIELYYNLGGVYDALKQPDKASVYYEKGSSLAKSQADRTTIFNSFCWAADRSDDLMRKIDFNEMAIAAWPKAYPDEPNHLMHPLMNLAKSYARGRMWGKAEEKLNYALQIKKKGNVSKQYQLQISDWLGYVFANTKRPKQALESYRSAENIAEELKYNSYAKFIRGEEKHVLTQMNRVEEANKLNVVDYGDAPTY